MLPPSEGVTRSGESSSKVVPTALHGSARVLVAPAIGLLSVLRTGPLAPPGRVIQEAEGDLTTWSWKSHAVSFTALSSLEARSQVQPTLMESVE